MGDMGVLAAALPGRRMKAHIGGFLGSYLRVRRAEGLWGQTAPGFGLNPLLMCCVTQASHFPSLNLTSENGEHYSTTS